ncbi:MAG TPA: S8 family serine peptidase [Candidatus Sulfotelmatobacter sp.]|nr:S8 family serine peptidase [Candidatus Sulfotelmatobacter sp.]
MERKQKLRKPAGRNERHSAAWGKRLSLIMVLATSMAFGQPSAGQGRPSSRIASELSGLLAKAKQGASKGETVRVIVQYKQVPTSAHYSTMKNRGGLLHSKLHMIKGAAFTIPVSALPLLEADPEIASVTIDHPMNVMDDLTNTATGVASAWNSGWTGAGIGVAVIDSGINDSHPDLWDSSETTSRVVYHQDFTGTATTNANGANYDLYGHGTHVAGIIGGNGYLSGGQYEGVAPGVSLIDLRALDANGAGTDSTVIAAIQQAIALKDTYNIRVINLSLGRGIPVSYTQDPLCQAVESAWKSGIVVVVAAGNYGRLSVNGSNGFGTITAPGNDPFVLTVGATKSNGSSAFSAETKASYSSKGPTTYDHVVKPDIMAPGNAIVSLAAPGATLEAAYPGDIVTGTDGKADYFTLSGTSMATPAVAGAVALLLQEQNTLTPDQVKARLMKTANKMGLVSTSAYVPHLLLSFLDFYDLFSVGSGLLNVQGAASNGDLAPANVGAALSPSASYNPLTGTVSLVYGNSTVSSTSVVWGSSVVWGTSVVWGSSLVNGTSVVWGSSLPWNNNLLSAFSVVWGSSTGTASATSVVWGSSVGNATSAFSDAGDDEQ